ncbi:MAG: CRISPR-associated protein Cas4 [Desulfohalobiaceae bacterium]|nr:CRISPR-associated protein Cas4 [Desulfohalobiaceae bacterium]
MEEELVPLSALQHLLYCKRQCALIHVDGVWTENRYTAEGRIVHERAHQSGGQSRGEVRTETGVYVRSSRLGLVGQADVVEFHREQGGIWRPYPVEYKRGRAKPEDWDRVQLCAQAVCLEEMLELEVPRGAIYYDQPRRREPVEFDNELRSRVEEAVSRAREILDSGILPVAEQGSRCRRCSLAEICLPGTRKRSVQSYMSDIGRE